MYVRALFRVSRREVPWLPDDQATRFVEWSSEVAPDTRGLELHDTSGLRDDVGAVQVRRVGCSSLGVYLTLMVLGLWACARRCRFGTGVIALREVRPRHLLPPLRQRCAIPILGDFDGVWWTPDMTVNSRTVEGQSFRRSQSAAPGVGGHASRRTSGASPWRMRPSAVCRTAFRACSPLRIPIQIITTPGQMTWVREVNRSQRWIYMDEKHPPNRAENLSRALGRVTRKATRSSSTRWG